MNQALQLVRLRFSIGSQELEGLLAALAKYSGLTPCTVPCSSKGYDMPFDFYGLLHAHGAPTHTQSCKNLVNESIVNVSNWDIHIYMERVNDFMLLVA